MALSKVVTPLGQVYLFAAFPAEAKPLISHFKLKKELSVTAFTIYRNPEITLTVTGLGKAAMAAGLAYTLALFPAATVPILLNVGIVGHQDQPLGSIFCAEKIIDQDSQRVYYPQLVATPPCPSQTLTTVSSPELAYAGTSLYEMEASAFYETAIRFSSSELIQCIKVVSDNQANPVAQIKPAQVSELIMMAIPVIKDYINLLSQLALLSQNFKVPFYTEIITQAHFTNQQKLQLKMLLSKRAVLMTHKLDLTELMQNSAKVIVEGLQQDISQHKFGGF
ncbi:MAG: adenosylhomocysteine nucleosidase [Methyloprofundus sp.]|nr:MAG: adenosylhomocysteine nucleosidase [Methyloprofundus sp.]